MAAGESGRARRASGTEAIEDYAKAIYAISRERDGLGAQRRGGRAARGDAGDRDLDAEAARRASAWSTTCPTRASTLTPAGEKVALEVIRHHRLIEAYLSEALGMPSDRVHEEAEVLEHYISEELELLIAAKLGEPSHDPHGTPIPGPDLLPPPGR